VIAGVAGVIAGIFARLQARQIAEAAIEDVGGRVWIKLEENAIDFAIDRRRLSRIDLVGYIVVVATWHLTNIPETLFYGRLLFCGRFVTANCRHGNLATAGFSRRIFDLHVFTRLPGASPLNATPIPSPGGIALIMQR
jgi:hypothetical protein